MAVVIVDFNQAIFPQAIAVNGTQLTALNDGKWRATFTFSSSSASLATGGTFHALLACNDLGGMWAWDDGGTLKISIFQNTSGSPIIADVAAAFPSGAVVTIVDDNPNDELILSGPALTAGAGSHAFSGSTTGDAFGTSPLGGCVYGGGGFTGACSAMSDVDDGNDAVDGAASTPTPSAIVDDQLDGIVVSILDTV